MKPSLLNQNLFAEGHEFAIVDQVLSNAATVRFAQELAELPELHSLTFENNRITDVEAVCALLSNLKNFDKIESLNIRQNDFPPAVVAALADGIANKKELRVSEIFAVCTNICFSLTVDS